MTWSLAEWWLRGSDTGPTKGGVRFEYAEAYGIDPTRLLLYVLCPRVPLLELRRGAAVIWHGLGVLLREQVLCCQQSSPHSPSAALDHQHHCNTTTMVFDQGHLPSASASTRSSSPLHHPHTILSMPHRIRRRPQDRSRGRHGRQPTNNTTRSRPCLRPWPAALGIA